jgi:glutamate/tyrosine decarboxylase-like PLP-dependent enzyme
MHIPFPAQGTSQEEIKKQLAQFSDQDANWKRGRTFSLVFYPGEEVAQLLFKAYETFFFENALNPSVFKSLKRMESEVISMTCSLLHAPENAAGSMTSGGTESIMCAMKAAKKYAKDLNKDLKKPNIVIPATAHPAFLKAAYYFEIEVRLAKCTGFDLVPDMADFRSKIDENTIMIVGSSPAYPHGYIDPLKEISDLAIEKNLWMHVDACVGGYILPFLEQIGENVPVFDFRLAGVRSISLDIHKYGYGAKGSSAVVYRDREFRKKQYYVYTEWPGGLYASPSFSGSRSGGVIAAAWSIMKHLGLPGYQKMAKETQEAAKKIQQAINSIDGISVNGQPFGPIFSFRSTGKLDIYQLGDELTDRGWHLDRQMEPPSLHLTVSHGNVAYADEFIQDLKESVAKLTAFSISNVGASIQQKVVSKAAGVLPESWLKAMFKSSIDKINDPKASTKTAPLYGLMGELSGSGTLEDMVLDLLDAMHRKEEN